MVHRRCRPGDHAQSPGAAWRRPAAQVAGLRATPMATPFGATMAGAGATGLGLENALPLVLNKNQARSPHVRLFIRPTLQPGRNDHDGFVAGHSSLVAKRHAAV